MAQRYPFLNPYLENLYRAVNSQLSPILNFEACLNLRDKKELEYLVKIFAEMFMVACRIFDYKGADHEWLERCGGQWLADEQARNRAPRLKNLCAEFHMGCRQMEYQRDDNISLPEYKEHVLEIARQYDMIVRIAAYDQIEIPDLMEVFR